VTKKDSLFLLNVFLLLHNIILFARSFNLSLYVYMFITFIFTHYVSYYYYLYFL